MENGDFDGDSMVILRGTSTLALIGSQPLGTVCEVENHHLQWVNRLFLVWMSGD